LVKHLRSEKVNADTLESLAATATISCRDETIGKMIATIVKEAGNDGMITIEDRYEVDTIYERQDGLKLAGGFLNEFFINQPTRQQTVFEDVPILITDRSITIAEEMGKIMETVANMGKKEAVVIAAGIDGDALATAFVNWQKKAIFILPIRVLTYGDAGQGALKDVAAITGATYLDEHEKPLVDITREDFGRVSKIITDKRETTVISNNEELKKDRLKQLNNAMKTATEFETDNLKQRISRLKSAVYTIKVGGKTETDRNELKTRVDDAIKAAKAAYEDGVIAGGGSALYRAVKSQKVPDVTTDIGLGEVIVYRACVIPIEQMAINSNIKLDRTDLANIAADKALAIDFSTGEVVDAHSRGVIDPLKVVVDTSGTVPDA
jgi:chaperonin GroEL